MTIRNQNVTDYVQGDTLTIDVQVLDKNGDPKDITGATFEWVLVEEYGSGDPLLEKTTNDDITIVTATNGDVRVAVDPADTEDIAPGMYRHELEMTDSNGDVSTVLVGQVEILRGDT